MHASEPRAAALEPGPLLFARYAFRPNELGYCGGDDARSLFDHVREGVVDGDVLRLDREFEGAFPYLRLIAASNGIADPLDRRVVEAYWLGNGLLDRIPATAFRDDLRLRFRARTDPREWRWLSEHPARGARAHHSFHVLSVLPRTGLLRDGRLADVLGAMERCMIRPARVVAVDGGDLLVEARPLELRDGRLVVGEPRIEMARRWLDVRGAPIRSPSSVSGTAASGTGAGFVDGVLPGDCVALHWGWACAVLEPDRRRRLEAVTDTNLRIAAASV